MLFTLILLSIFLKICSKREMKHITVSIESNHTGSRGKESVVTVRASGKHTAMTGRMKAYLKVNNKTFGTVKKDAIYLFWKEEHKGYEGKFKLANELCGEVYIEITKMRGIDCLGLSSNKVKLPKGTETKMIIYPELVPLDKLWSEISGWLQQGDSADCQRMGSDPEDVYDIREYQVGDSLQKIHWKLSGKWDRLLVREYSASESEELLLLVDISDSEPEEICSLYGVAASMSYELLEECIAHTVGISCGETLFRYEVKDFAEYERMMTAMVCTSTQKKNIGETFSYNSIQEEYAKIFHVTLT